MDSTNENYQSDFSVWKTADSYVCPKRMVTKERYTQLELYFTLNLDGLLKLERESPRDVDLLLSIGRSYFNERQLDRCHEYYSKALEIDPNYGWTHLYIGNLYYGLSCYTEAASHFERAIELLPGVACPHWCLADVYDKQGYWERTEKQYRVAVETDPSDDQAKRKLENWLAEHQAVVSGISRLS